MRFLLFLVLLTGCNAFAPTSPPSPSLPESFRITPPGIETRDEWWRDLQSPALNAIINEAFLSAPDIRTARARLERARAEAVRSGAQLWPSLDASAEAVRNRSKAKGRNVAETDAYGLGLAASYEIDLWGRVRSVQQAGTMEAQASAEDLRTAALTLSGEIAENWISLCSARLQMDILVAQQRTNADILSTLELRFANSLASALDVLQQREAIAQTTTLIAPLRAETVRLENLINLLAGRTPGALDLSAATWLPHGFPLPATGIPADLLANRPDIRADRNRLLGAGWSLAAAEADRMPALRLTGRFEQEGDAVARIFDNWLANLAASLTAPIIDGGSRKAEVERQRAIREERLAAYEKTVFSALSEVDTLVSGIRNQEELLAALLAQRDAAQAALTSARIRYQNGVIAYDTVLSLLLKLQQLERTQIREQANLLTLHTGLCRALGKGWRDAFPEASPNSESEKS